VTAGLAEASSLTEALDRAAASVPDATFVRIQGRDVSYRDFSHDVGRLAGGLAERGVGVGDHVVVFMRNSLGCVHTWFAVNRLGAVWVPVNTAFQGPGLAHVAGLVTPRLVICDAELLDPMLAALREAGCDSPVVVHGGAQTEAEALDDLYRSPLAEAVSRLPSDPSAMLFTSGTTGRSKACVLSHRYFLAQATTAIRELGLRSDDVLYCPFPLFHIDATALTVVPALLLHATAAIGERFSASGFWAEVSSTGATVFDFMGATLSILHKAAPSDDDADNPVRLAWGVPLPEWVEEFERRFDLRIVELYGSTEANLPIVQPPDRDRVPGSCGRVVDGFEIRVVDQHDEPVPTGMTGELLVRADRPFTLFSGYHAMPAATSEAIRNFWFHTGDLVSIDADENVFFEGRLKDAIRRRGENISAFEVEEAILTHPDIVECAVLGVPSELTEEDLKAVVVARSGASITPEDAWEHSRTQLAPFQVPRYVQIVEELPKTPTGKIEKYRLAETPFEPGTWDAERR
jgi:carnitine-CoA ligase